MQGETQLSITRSILLNRVVKEGWSRISLTVQLQEQAGTAGRTQGSVSKRQDQGLEQMEAAVGSQDHTPEPHPSPQGESWRMKPSAKLSTQYLNPEAQTVARGSDCCSEFPGYSSQFGKGFGSC